MSYPIVDWPGCHVDLEGRVTVDGTKTVRPHVLRGTQYMDFYRYGQRHRRALHVIMAEVFLNQGQRIPRSHYVRFRDGNRANIAPSNLEISPRQNLLPPSHKEAVKDAMREYYKTHSLSAVTYDKLKQYIKDQTGITLSNSSLSRYKKELM